MPFVYYCHKHGKRTHEAAAPTANENATDNPTAEPVEQPDGKTSVPLPEPETGRAICPIETNLEVHHITALADGGAPYDPANLAPSAPAATANNPRQKTEFLGSGNSTPAQQFAENSGQKVLRSQHCAENASGMRNVREADRIPGCGPPQEVLRCGVFSGGEEQTASGGSELRVQRGAQDLRSEPGSAAALEGEIAAAHCGVLAGPVTTRRRRRLPISSWRHSSRSRLSTRRTSPRASPRSWRSASRGSAAASAAS